VVLFLHLKGVFLQQNKSGNKTSLKVKTNEFFKGRMAQISVCEL
jgi:hypothetical protein